jgi:flagellar P-ring protein precursor FlgI
MGVARRPVEVLEGSIGMPCIRSARVIWVACAALMALVCSTISASATSRIKDLAN